MGQDSWTRQSYHKPKYKLNHYFVSQSSYGIDQSAAWCESIILLNDEKTQGTLKQKQQTAMTTSAATGNYT